MWNSKKRLQDAREEFLKKGRAEGYAAGRDAERAVISGKQPPPPRWERNVENY